MFTFLASRVVYTLVVVWGVSIAVFLLIRLGGDPTALFLPPEANAEEIVRMREALGFDRPYLIQYVDFLLRALGGDFGFSLRQQQPAMGLVLDRLPATLELGAVALALSLLIGIPLGLVSATHRGSWIDRLAMLVSLFGQSFPAFWLAIMMILLFSETLTVLPPSGRGGLAHLVMPGTALAAFSTAIITRLLRSSMIEVLQSDYIRTARSKGLAPRAVIFRHALRNAAIPTLTVVGLQVGALLGGAVITEEVFAYPGVGRLAVQAIAQRDFAVVQAFVIFSAVLIVSINLLIDAVYVWLDPRLRQR